ncbi:MAG TPA: hypothetical protein VFL95_01125 [Gemmatimonadales bacterium]|nr:hypothetical protein [Gemmatimonadales bacterium]
MTKISSNLTLVQKRIFPGCWFGFLTLFVVAGLLRGAERENIGFLIVPVVMAAFGYQLMKTMVWNLADEVYDCGDSLLIRKGGEQVVVPLSNIMNVSADNVSRVTLKLVQPVSLGDEIAFAPRSRAHLNPFARSAVAGDLMVRAHQARAIARS